MEIIDVSVPVRPGMIVYDGDPDVHMERVKTIAGGASANVSRVDFGVHTGTHIDAPVHFIEGAPAMERLFGALCGEVRAIDTTDGLRMTFENGEIVHLRPSGNAPEFRCYNEAGTQARAAELNRACLAMLSAQT